ncbi:hypothetical protein ACWD33_26375 [Streptomyces xiamenensis]
MAESTASRLVTQKELRAELGIGKWIIDDRIARFPQGHPHAFPVRYIGRWRRFDPAEVKAWFAQEANGLISRSPAAA